METQRGYVNCPRSHSCTLAMPGLTQRTSDLKPLLFYTTLPPVIVSILFGANSQKKCDFRKKEDVVLLDHMVGLQMSLSSNCGPLNFINIQKNNSTQEPNNLLSSSAQKTVFKRGLPSLQGTKRAEGWLRQAVHEELIYHCLLRVLVQLERKHIWG